MCHCLADDIIRSTDIIRWIIHHPARIAYYHDDVLIMRTQVAHAFADIGAAAPRNGEPSAVVAEPPSPPIEQVHVQPTDPERSHAKLAEPS